MKVRNPVLPVALALGALVFAACGDSSRRKARLDRIQADYRAATAELAKHVVEEQWIDDDPQSPKRLSRVWQLGAEWVGAWLGDRRVATVADVKAALTALAKSETPVCLPLGTNTFLVAAPGPIGNVFIIARVGNRYRLVWSIAQPQRATGTQAALLAAWQARNAQHRVLGPHWAASDGAGPVILSLGRLPSDQKGRPRFYIDGTYAQAAGGTVGGQTTVWVWNGTTAQLLAARDYPFMIDQKVRTRLEGDLLKVQQKKSFRSFFSCGACEERQTDWIVRLTPAGVEDLGEQPVVPELDAVDELLDRLIHGRPAAELATPAAVQGARKMVHEARSFWNSEKEWKEFPSLGMMSWTIARHAGESIVCITTDNGGTGLFTMKPAGDHFLITQVRLTQECPK